jgi:hypothetical protein
MKNWLNTGIFAILVMVTVIMSGCTTTGISPSLSDVTTITTGAIPSTPIPTLGITSVPTTSIQTITPTRTATLIIPIKIPFPKADATVLSEITFLHYSDPDFSVDYPSTWTITTSTYTPYYCRGATDTTRYDYHVCYQNETKSIGPFYFYQDNDLKAPSRIVTFTSADGKLKFVSFTTDISDAYNGYFRQEQTLGWCKERFHDNYPDLRGHEYDYIGNYKFTQPPTNTFGVATYDVIMPKNSQYYPLAYTAISGVTMHSINEFAFITDNDNFNTYRNLKDYMLSSITTSR